MPSKPITIFGPDFPFAYDDWISHTKAFELMKLGVKPVIYETGRMGGRLRSEHFANATGVVAEMGGMRFPKAATAFNYYTDLLELRKKPFPNPLTSAAQSTVIDLAGETTYAESTDDLPPVYKEVSDAWDEALNTEAQFEEIQAAIKARDVNAIKHFWDK